MPTRRSRRRRADDAFPTVVRYVGVLIIVMIAVNTIFRGGVEYPGLIVAATGMILYKTVRGSGTDGDDSS